MVKVTFFSALNLQQKITVIEVFLMPNQKLKDSEVRPRTSAYRYRHTRRKHPLMVYFTDEEILALDALSIRFKANKSALMRLALNLYNLQPERMDFMMKEAKTHPDTFCGLFTPI